MPPGTSQGMPELAQERRGPATIAGAPRRLPEEEVDIIGIRRIALSEAMKHTKVEEDGKQVDKVTNPIERVKRCG